MVARAGNSARRTSAAPLVRTVQFNIDIPPADALGEALELPPFLFLLIGQDRDVGGALALCEAVPLRWRLRTQTVVVGPALLDELVALQHLLLALHVDLVELVEELPVKQVPPGDVVVGRKLLSHQSGVHFVDEHEDPFGHFTNGFGRMVQTARAELRQCSAR